MKAIHNRLDNGAIGYKLLLVPKVLNNESNSQLENELKNEK